jgi:hypothetical protein
LHTIAVRQQQEGIIMKELVIDIAPTGRTEGMHFDEFDLCFLGNKQVERASEIIWDETGQSWFIKLPDDDLVAPANAFVGGFVGYDTARTFEVSWLQGCRKGNVSPRSPEGVKIARVLRESGNF